jgi:uncharacterized protein
MAKSTTSRVATTVMWRRLDAPGHDVCRLIRRESGWALEGHAVFLHARMPCALSYSVECDHAFHTRTAHVRGWLGRKPFVIDATRDVQSNWRLNGTAVPAVRGCIDVDINVSPSTNLLSLRRLRPRTGTALAVRAAWLEFPQMKFTPLEQVYTRTSTTTYDYAAPSLKFARRLVVDRHGMVLEYPPLWTQERGVGALRNGARRESE